MDARPDLHCGVPDGLDPRRLEEQPPKEQTAALIVLTGLLAACVVYSLANLATEFFGWLKRPTEAVTANHSGLLNSSKLVVPGFVESVHDGDTLTVAITMRVDVRLINCWAPELKEPRGKEAGDALRHFAAAKPCIVTVPVGRKLGDSMSFGRVVGQVEVEGQDLSEWMVGRGLATKHKEN